MSERKRAIIALNTVIDKPKNVDVFIRNLDKLDLRDDEYLRAVYQIIGDILSLKEGKLKPILSNLKKGSVNWKHKMFNTIEEKIREHDDYIVHPFEVVEGIAECGKCGSRRTYSFQKQTRSSDEPMTTFTKCANRDCGNEWSYSG